MAPFDDPFTRAEKEYFGQHSYTEYNARQRKSLDLIALLPDNKLRVLQDFQLMMAENGSGAGGGERRRDDEDVQMHDQPAAQSTSRINQVAEHLIEIAPGLLSSLSMLLPKGEKQWTLPLRAVTPALNAITNGQIPEAGELPGISGLLNYVDRDDVHLLPEDAQLEYWKLDVERRSEALLRSPSPPLPPAPAGHDEDDLDHSEHGTAEKGKPIDHNEALIQDIKQGLMILAVVESETDAILGKVRLVANSRGHDEDQEMHRRRVQCIICTRANIDLMKSLCDCGGLDPRHLMRQNIQQSIQSILEDPAKMAKIDRYVKAHPDLFQEFVERAEDDYGDTSSMNNSSFPGRVRECLSCIVSRTMFSDQAATCSLARLDQGDFCMQCKDADAEQCRVLCADCLAIASPQGVFNAAVAFDLDPKCESCLFHVKQDEGENEEQGIGNSQDEYPLQGASFDSITLPNNSKLLWDNDGLDIGNDLVQKLLQTATTDAKMLLAMPTNDLIKVKAFSDYKNGVRTSDVSKQKVSKVKLQHRFDYLLALYKQTGRYNVCNAAAFLWQKAKDELNIDLGEKVEAITSATDLVNQFGEGPSGRRGDSVEGGDGTVDQTNQDESPIDAGIAILRRACAQANYWDMDEERVEEDIMVLTGVLAANGQLEEFLGDVQDLSTGSAPQMYKVLCQWHDRLLRDDALEDKLESFEG